MEGEKIYIPRMGVNDDHVIITEWLVQSGDYVSKGQTIAMIETSKASVELKAEKEGFIKLAVEEWEALEIGAEIASLMTERDMSIPVEDRRNTGTVEKGYTFTKKAELFLAKHPEIDYSKLSQETIIKEDDLEKLIQKPFTIAETYSNRLLILGRGGFCKHAVDIIQQTNVYQIDGILEFHYPENTEIYGIPVLGDEEALQSFYEKGYKKVVNSVGFRERKHYRKPSYSKIKDIGYELPNLVDRDAKVAPTVKMGEGNMICAGAYIGSDSILGNNIIINVNAVVSHDCIISDHCHIASGAVLASDVIVNENTLIGQGSSIYMGVKIGRNVIIQNGCHVFKDIPDNTVITS